MKILSARYIVLIVMVVSISTYIFFFDKNDLAHRRKLIDEIEQLEAQVEYYKNEIAEDSLLLEQLKDDEFLEAYARENFLMKRSGETVIVIE